MVVVLLASIGATQIVGTYNVLTQTYDEAAHLAAGMQWLDHGTYDYEFLHPPLARVATAILPYLDGLRLPPVAEMFRAGNEILHARGTYARNLVLARLGILPFFLMGTVLVWRWARADLGDGAGLCAVGLLVTLPPLLGHAGLATTDMAVTATLLGALLVLTRWLDQPTLGYSVALGLAAGVAVLSKLSVLVFLPAAGAAFVLVRWLAVRTPGGGPPRAGALRRPVAAAVSVVFVALVIWGGYRFSVAPMAQVEPRLVARLPVLLGQSRPMVALAEAAAAVPFPAPEFALGIGQLALKNAKGHGTYVLGQERGSGTWFYFPLVLAIKTPLPFLLLAGVGTVAVVGLARRRGSWRPLAPVVAAVAMLVVCLPSNINIGVRHILPIYPLLAIVAGGGAVAIWRSGRRWTWARPALVALAIWQIWSAAHTWPDHLAYFNEVAAEQPERFLVVGDLDWGQDLKRLSAALRARGVDEVAIRYYGTAELSRHELPRIRPLVPGERTTGWIAISMRDLVMDERFGWLGAYRPVEIVGRSIRLYYVVRPTGDGHG